MALHEWNRDSNPADAPQRHKTYGGAARTPEPEGLCCTQVKTKGRETGWAAWAWSLPIPGAPHFSTSLTRGTSYLRIGKHSTHTQPTPIILLILAVKTPRTRTRTDVVRWHVLCRLSTNLKETPAPNDKPLPRLSKRAGILDRSQLGCGATAPVPAPHTNRHPQHEPYPHGRSAARRPKARGHGAQAPHNPQKTPSQPLSRHNNTPIRKTPTGHTKRTTTSPQPPCSSPAMSHSNPHPR